VPSAVEQPLVGRGHVRFILDDQDLVHDSSRPPGGLWRVCEPTQDIRFGDDVDQVPAVEDGQGPDLVLQHQPRGVARLLIGADDDHARGHHLVDGSSVLARKPSSRALAYINL